MLTPEELRELKSQRRSLNRLGAALAEPDEKAPTIYSQKYTQCSIQKLPNARAEAAREYLDLVILINELLAEPINFVETYDQLEDVKAGTLQPNEMTWHGTTTNPIHIDRYIQQVDDLISNIYAQLESKGIDTNTINDEAIQIKLAKSPIQQTDDKWTVANMKNTEPMIANVVIPYIYYTTIKLPR